MQNRIAIIGAGQLGSRYLQGLATIDRPLEITVVDPSGDSLEIARERLNEVQAGANHEVIFTNCIEKAPDQIDVAVIATPANCRAHVINELSNKKSIKAWILEKVLAQSCEQLEQINKDIGMNEKVWVNTPMRIMEWHKSIKKGMIIGDANPINVQIKGGSWGMACNAIHYIDLVSWWCENEIEEINSEELKNWQDSKRQGFKEINGKLKVNYSEGSSLELECDDSQEPLIISIKKRDSRKAWIINESEGTAWGPNGEVIKGELTYQSALTGIIVKRILDYGKCELTTLATSTHQHRLLLNALLQKWNLGKDKEELILPIT